MIDAKVLVVGGGAIGGATAGMLAGHVRTVCGLGVAVIALLSACQRDYLLDVLNFASHASANAPGIAATTSAASTTMAVQATGNPETTYRGKRNELAA